MQAFDHAVPQQLQPLRGKVRRHHAGDEASDVTKTLEEEGVASFTKSFDELITSLETKADALR